MDLKVHREKGYKSQIENKNKNHSLVNKGNKNPK